MSMLGRCRGAASPTGATVPGGRVLPNEEDMGKHEPQDGRSVCQCWEDAVEQPPLPVQQSLEGECCPMKKIWGSMNPKMDGVYVNVGKMPWSSLPYRCNSPW